VARKFGPDDGAELVPMYVALPSGRHRRVYLHSTD
jgi:hypothetical protein